MIIIQIIYEMGFAKMFIKDVVTKIWEPVSIEYGGLYAEAMELSPEKLFEKVTDKLKSIENFILDTRELKMTRLLTTGCPHNHQNGEFSGCSMCDYMSVHLDMLALVSALKVKSPELYARAMRFSFDCVRGKSPKPGTVELITGHDCLNPDEIPDEAFDELMDKGDLFSRRPYKTIFETRISSITFERLEKWKQKLGKKVTVEVGIEVWDEWVRNHWINKNVTEGQIIEALDIIDKTGCEVSANILIGIPGLTEDISIELFKETYFKLYELGADYILCSPLCRKERTLQGYIHRSFKDNSVLEKAGLVHGEETGMPSIFTVMDAVCSVIDERPESLNSMTLSPANFRVYFDMIPRIYKGNVAMEKCSEYIIDALKKFSATKDFQSFKKAKQIISETDSYKEYLAFKDRQNKTGGLFQVLGILGEEISKDLWPLDWERRLREFADELKTVRKSV